jgi:hypothetical protein
MLLTAVSASGYFTDKSFSDKEHGIQIKAIYLVTSVFIFGKSDFHTFSLLK